MRDVVRSTLINITRHTTMTHDLFGFEETHLHKHVLLGEQAIVLRAFAQSYLDKILPALQDIIHLCGFRHMVTPGGHTMSVAMSNCGRLGWITDHQGYRYTDTDPLTGKPWPCMPPVFLQLAQAAANTAGFPGFLPDACLINRYLPESNMSLHQDKNERNMAAPIVSISLGMPAMFLFGGNHRQDKAQRIPLFHGDVTVWGGVDRLRFHGVMPIKANAHSQMGEQRINLTFRQAG